MTFGVYGGNIKFTIMRISLTELCNQEKNVYILRIGRWNNEIKNSNTFPYALGISYNERLNRVVVVKNAKKIMAVPCWAISDLSSIEIDLLINEKKIIPYSKLENDARLERHRIHDKNKKYKKNIKDQKDKIEKKRIEDAQNDIRLGNKKFIDDNLWMKINSLDLKERSTIYEKIVFRSLPKILKNNAVTQKPFKINGRKYFADIYIKKINTVIEIDGDYHKDRESIDKLRDEDFLSIGIKTVRIPNSEVKDGGFIKTIKTLLKQYEEAKCRQ